MSDHLRRNAPLPRLPKPPVPAARPSGTRPRTTLREDLPNVGELVADRYVVERIIAEGGFGVVVAARHVELEETVAIKFLKPEFAHVPDVVGRFAREAKASALIKNEHTPIVYDVGVSSERGPYIVMEYLEGEDLLSLVRTRGPLPIPYAIELVLQACEAIAAAHAHGIVHRDIKPENLFVVRRPHSPELVKVLDFGVSKAVLTGNVFGTALSMLKTQNLVGTPLYMSPEQLRGQSDVGPPSDIWSLGAVLYELLTAQTAFRGASVTEVCASVLEVAPEPPASIRPDLPADLAAIIMRCLEKKSAARFAGVAELALALGPFAPASARSSVERTRAIAKSAGLPGGDAVAASDLAAIVAEAVPATVAAAVAAALAATEPLALADLAPPAASTRSEPAPAATSEEAPISEAPPPSSQTDERIALVDPRELAPPSPDGARNVAIVALVAALAAIVIAFASRQQPPREPVESSAAPANNTTPATATATAAPANPTAAPPATATDDGLVSAPIVRFPALVPVPSAPVAAAATDEGAAAAPPLPRAAPDRPAATKDTDTPPESPPTVPAGDTKAAPQGTVDVPE